jgi:hypothetical protein
LPNVAIHALRERAAHERDHPRASATRPDTFTGLATATTYGRRSRSSPCTITPIPSLGIFPLRNGIRAHHRVRAALGGDVQARGADDRRTAPSCARIELDLRGVEDVTRLPAAQAGMHDERARRVSDLR